VPEQPEDTPGIQSNDIGCDDEGRLYLIDRWGQGMHILEYTGLRQPPILRHHNQV
jgi:hypothetical protein